MANSTLPVTEGAGRLLDTEQATVAGNTVERQRIQIAGADGDGYLTMPANDSVDSGSPLKIGGRASVTVPTQVADADRVNAWFDRSGALHTLPVAQIGKIKPMGGAMGNMVTAIFDAAVVAATPQAVIAATAAFYNYIMWFSIGVSANTKVYLTNGSGGANLYKLQMGANTSLHVAPPVGNYLFRTTPGVGVHVDVSNNATVVITVGYLVSQGNVDA